MWDSEQPLRPLYSPAQKIANVEKILGKARPTTWPGPFESELAAWHKWDPGFLLHTLSPLLPSSSLDFSKIFRSPPCVFSETYIPRSLSLSWHTFFTDLQSHIDMCLLTWNKKKKRKRYGRRDLQSHGSFLLRRAHDRRRFRPPPSSLAFRRPLRSAHGPPNPWPSHPSIAVVEASSSVPVSSRSGLEKRFVHGRKSSLSANTPVLWNSSSFSRWEKTYFEVANAACPWP